MYPTTNARRLFAVLAMTVVSTILGGVAPANAAASGQLLMKGTGSLYTDFDIVNLGITPGPGSKTFSFKVVNTGLSNQQFKVVGGANGGGGYTAKLFSGYKAVSSPFITPAIKPGGSVVLTMKITVAAGQPQDEYPAPVQLRDPDTDALLDTATPDANATYQTGTTQHDLFLKTGSQPFVGGSVEQYETASTIKAGGIVTYTIRLKNNGAGPATMTLHGQIHQCSGDFAVTVKQGVTDVTAAVDAGTYSTGILNPGAKKELKVSIKLVADNNNCMASYFFFEATGPDGQIGSSAHVVIAA